MQNYYKIIYETLKTEKSLALKKLYFRIIKLIQDKLLNLS